MTEKDADASAKKRAEDKAARIAAWIVTIVVAVVVFVIMGEGASIAMMHGQQRQRLRSHTQRQYAILPGLSLNGASSRMTAQKLSDWKNN
jgi:flagellar basal body-associated protein FliL